MFTPAEIKTCKQFLNNIVHLDIGRNFWGESMVTLYSFQAVPPNVALPVGQPA